MKTREQEPDYRSLSEVQLKYELIQLEKRILRITGDPLASGGKGYRRFFCWASNKNSVERVQELIYKRTSSLARQILSVPREELDDDLTVEGKLVPEFDLTSSVLRLEDDAYYGSDFVRMAAILQETEEYQPGMADVRCYLDQIKNYTPAITDEQLGCANTMDDGTTWGEAWLLIPPLEHIIICHALHALVTHMNWSIPDVLRINDFKIEVTLTVQQYSELHDIMEDVASRLWSSDAPYNYTIHFIGAIEAVQTMLDPYKDRYGLHLSADPEDLLFLRKYEAVNWGMTQENIGTLKIYTQLTCGVILVTTLRKCVVKSARYFDARLITDALKLEDYASLVDFLRKTYAQDSLASEHLLEWVQINCPTAALTAEQADAILHVE